MKTAKTQVSRRKFLLAATAGTAASAAAIVAKTKSDSDAKQSADAEAKRGYQLSEHVRNYYRTAKI